METEWKGSVRDLVRYAAGTDARETVVDSRTGAKIRINIDGGDFEETDEPFYIEYGDNLYDASDRREAVMILSNIRKGKKFPDMYEDSPKRKPAKGAKPRSRKQGNAPLTSLRGMRR